MGNYTCSNYYCQNISYKPEWISENSWTFEYNIDSKPYNIDKGVLKINNTKKCNILLYKKLLINFDEIRNITIPINFKYFLLNNIDVFIIFSKELININNINSLHNNSNLFFIKLNLSKNKINIVRSFNNKNINKKIKSVLNNNFILNIENNFNVLSINEKLINSDLNNIYEKKYINNMSINEDNEYYLSLYIENKYDLLHNNLEYFEYLELNFQ
jgi:hypothetical protein